jgi:TusA-related sulfurtransferase
MPGSLMPIDIPVPHGVLEAGGEPSTALLAAIGRHIQEMHPGQVLEVISGLAGARLDAIAWCHATGHELLALVGSEGEVRFWIRKRELEGEGT